MTSLGKLVRIKDITQVWKHEAHNFTPWLAKAENLALIGETLGFGSDWLELVETEGKVGPFRADIVCSDTGHEDRIVVIENQFGKTNHDHLGKLLTYAAGQKAKVAIWIAEVVQDEHRAALDMLNSSTGDDFQFFALEIELWQIGDSEIAPRFNIAAKPNEWSRSVAKRSVTQIRGELTDLKQSYIEYWTDFQTALHERSVLRSQKPGPRQWIYMPIGKSKITLTASLNSQEKWTRASLELHDHQGFDYFTQLLEQRDEIDRVSDFDLEWDDLPTRKGARISITRSNTDPTTRSLWPDQHQWLIERLVHLYELFHDRVALLSSSKDLDDLLENT